MTQHTVMQENGTKYAVTTTKAYGVPVVGTIAERQETLKEFYERYNRSDIAVVAKLWRDSDDPRVRVIMRCEDWSIWGVVGYLPDALTEKLVPRLDAGERVLVTEIRLGKRGDVYGARIDLEWADNQQADNDLEGCP